MKRISKAKRAHLVMCCEVAESIASGMRHLRKTKPWTVAPEGKAFDVPRNAPRELLALSPIGPSDHAWLRRQGFMKVAP